MHSMAPVKVSVVVTTYNWPEALQAVLKGLAGQKTSRRFEIIVADDGSQEETAKLIRAFEQEVAIPLLHIWQPDEGFRAAAIRNKAILAAEGSYIIFLDGDCIPRENFIENHLALAAPKTFVVGDRVLLSREFTLVALSQRLPLHQWSFWRWCVVRLRGDCNRVLPFLSLTSLSKKGLWLSLKIFSSWKGRPLFTFGIQKMIEQKNVTTGLDWKEGEIANNCQQKKD